MQFKVPQFLDVEDKIFGPFTFRQFIYLAGGAGICFVIYKAIGLLWGSLPILIIGIFVGALTFYRPNNKPFINMLEAGFKYFTQNKLYVWKKHKNKHSTPVRSTPSLAPAASGNASALGQDYSRLTGSKLKDLAWSLDVLDLSKKENLNN